MSPFPVDQTDVVTNAAPVATDDVFGLSENGFVSGDVLADHAGGVDSDGDGDALSVSLVSEVSSGVLALNGDGTFDYTPDADFNGVDSLTYEVSDGKGGTDQAVVTLNVAAVNDDPVAGDDGGFSTGFGTALEIAAADLLVKDDDGDPELTQTLSVQSVTSGVGGTAVLSGGVITFTPAAGFSRAASFFYTLSDGNSGEDTGTVSLNVGLALSKPSRKKEGLERRRSAIPSGIGDLKDEMSEIFERKIKPAKEGIQKAFDDKRRLKQFKSQGLTQHHFQEEARALLGKISVCDAEIVRLTKAIDEATEAYKTRRVA